MKAKPLENPMYTEDLLYEALMEPPPIPDLPPPPPPPLQPGIEFPAVIGLLPPSALPPPSVEFLSTIEEKSAPTLQATTDLQLLLYLEEVCHLPKAPPHSLLPKVQQLLPLQENRVLLNMVWTVTRGEGEGEGEGVRQSGGCLLLLGVEEGEGGSTVIVKTPLATLTYDRAEDIVQHLCSFPSSVHDQPSSSSSSSSSHLLAGVTQDGSARIFSLPDLAVISELRIDGGVCGQYVHCVPCPGNNKVVMTTTLGEVHVLELGQQVVSLEEEEEAEEEDLLPFKGIAFLKLPNSLPYLVPSLLLFLLLLSSSPPPPPPCPPLPPCPPPHPPLPFVDSQLPLTTKQLDLLQELYSSDPEGVLCPTLSPPHWEEVSPLKYHRQCPCHMLQSQENAAESRRGELFSTMVWQYVPQLCSSSAR